MQRTKKVISLVLSLMLVVSCFTCLASVRVFADDETNNSATFLYGDVDGDGKVKINDATAIQRHLAEQEGYILEPGTDAFKAADVDGDGQITIDDVTTIQRFLAEFIDHFPVEEAADDTIIVAGSEAEIFGTGWDGTNEVNLMTKQADGTYTREYTVEKAYDAVQLKAVVNGSAWIGDKTNNNVTFNLKEAGTFTVIYHPAVDEDPAYVEVTGDIVEFITEFEYNTVYAVGNGEGYWLNGAAWDPAYAANKMTKIADDVWEITFWNVPDGFERQIKFAIDGAWTHNFGGVFEDSGVETAAVYNGDNIKFDTEDVCAVTARLDLTEFDFSTKEGAKFTITVDYGVEETIEEVEETTEAVEETTEAVEETTEAVEETTEAVEETTEAVEDDTVIVAGSETEIFGTGWDGTNEDNLMTKQGDGTYTKEYTVEKAYDAVQLKAVVNGADWIGDNTGNNVTFNLTDAGTFTVTYYPATDTDAAYVDVSGDIVEFITEFTYDTVYAVGNGEGYWLNGAAWDPAYAANEMTEIAENVWEISFEEVPDGFERQIKFAIDGAWTHNFGGAFEESGVQTAAVYNGDNITFDTDDVCTVKAQLDLTEFDFTTKEGAKFTITVEYDEEEETTEAVEETTEEVEETTEAVEETTEAVEETTEAVEETTEAVEDDTVIVAGSETEIFGTGWDGTNEDNLMTKQADGTYTKEYTVTKAYDAVQLKAVVNGADWIGDNTGNNVTFNLTDAGTFTVIYHPAVDEEPAYVEVTGDIVEFITEFTYDTVYAVGNGEGWWLNGAAWDPSYAANEMTEIAENVWEISFENVPDGFERQIKFAIDGAWTHNFGGAFEESGVQTAAVYNGDNITFDTDDVCTVKAQLDLTEFDFTTKEGAKFTITVEYDEEEETTEAVEETTEEVEETTEAVEETTEAVEETTEAVEETTEAVEDDTVIVAGSETEIFGTGWDGTNEDNLMTKQADGTYTRDYTVTKAYDAVQLKAVVNGADWIGDNTGNNVTFNLTDAGTFTVIYHPAVDEEPAYVEVTGDIVEFITEFTYDTVYAVGNGEGYWLNGAAWDPSYAANEMTEIAENVWEISFENVPDGFERQIKFAIDGAWTHNFGGAFEESGVQTAAVYNGDNITFDTDDICTVKAQLDLTEFDFTTKEGAKFTITVEYDEEEETTEEVEETTEAVEETTEAVEETTEAVEETTEAVEDDTVIVAGSETEIFGTGWDGTNEDNLMTKQADGTYTRDYTVTKAYDAVQLKAVVNGADWIGDNTGNNVTFNLKEAGTFTVIYHPAVDEEPAYVEVTGDTVEFITEFTYDTVYAVGNGEGWWLNGAAWDPSYAANEMTEIAENVWEISFENVPDGFERQIKFAIDGAWTHNFGGAFEESGVQTAAVYNGDNITFDTDDICTVKAQLDLTEFDFTTKEGAKFTITVEYDEEEETTEAVEETTEEVEETTEAVEETTEAVEETTEAVEETTEAVEDDTVIVAGSETEIFGTGWDGTNEDNLMTKQSDGTYTRDYTVTKAYDAVQLKAVVNGADWIGDKTGNNVTFNLKEAGTFTVTYYPAIGDEAAYVDVSGDIVEFITEFEYSTVFAVGNGEGWWLNGAAWDPSYAANEMTEIEDDVWEITFENVPDGFERQIKFAIDGAWTYNFGGAIPEDTDLEQEDQWFDTEYNGGNITFDTDDICTVKVTLDLREFDFTTKTGAKFSIQLIY